jgi:hypothetical protein
MDDPQNPVPESAQYHLHDVLAAIEVALEPVLKRIRKLERRESQSERNHRLTSTESREARTKAWTARKKKQRDRARKRRVTPGNQDAEKRKRVLRDRKFEVLSHYGPDGKLGCSCPGCKITALELMSLDHVLGNGSEDRNAQGHRITGDNLYKRVKDAGYPPNYATMCLGCNFAKKQGRACPLAGRSHIGE